MSLTPEEQRELALDCDMAVSQGGNGYWDNVSQLAAYTAAVEAKRDEELTTLKQENESLSLEIKATRLNFQGWAENLPNQSKELQALREQKPVAYMYIDSSGKYSTPMLELKNTVSGYHECWKPYPLYSAPVPEIEWQSIESAPKDGRDILIYDDGITIGSWSKGFNTWNNGEWWIEGGQVTSSNATYWMPLPESPKGCT